ncbi:MAG: hypothetical protein B6I18_07100, partial [Bacteroidetes bacterium 4572_112]
MKNLYLLIIIILFVMINSTIKATSIIVGGPIGVNTTWNVDTINIVSDVTVNDNVLLLIAEGTYVQFMGHYSLNIQGQLLAQGTPENRIIFTAYNSIIGWAGIRFDNTPTSNNQSFIEYCTITYGKANTGTAEEKMGGAIFVKGTSDLVIRNNILSNNSASNYGGAITCRYSASPTIANNIICNNSSNNYGGGIYLYNNAIPKIANNTITNNSASQGGGIYANQSNPYIYNNIISGNQASSNSQLNTGLTRVNYNIIEGGYSGGNYNVLPIFVNPSSGVGTLYDGAAADWSLQSASNAINHGYPTASTVQSFFNISNFDAYGNFRFDNNRVDIGAVEYISSIEACGHITSNTVWSGNVLVNCDVIVDNGVTLTVQEGTKVLFTGHYKLDIKGRIVAKGTHDNYISYTAWDTEEGWQGISLVSIPTSNDSTIIEYCKISNKVYTNTGETHGAIYISASNKILIRNSIIANNKGKYGGGLTIYNSSINLIGNLIGHNEAISNGAGIRFSSDGSNIINNTIVANKNTGTNSGSGIYFGGTTTSTLKNNIVYLNANTNLSYSLTDNINSSGKDVTYSCVQGTYAGSNNISSDPNFKNATTIIGRSKLISNYNYAVEDGSDVIDAGTTVSVQHLPSLDLAGKTRNYSAEIDMGAYEDKSSLSVCGTISSDVIWNANTINIDCDVTIANGVTVTIVPGTKVNFNGHYNIDVQGRIVADGTESSKILFTATNTNDGWNSMYVHGSTSNDSTVLNYCKFEYSKNTSGSTSEGGGALTIKNNKTRVSNCEFENNQTNTYGGAIQVYYSSPLIHSNYMHANSASQRGGAMYVFYYKSNSSDPDLIIRNNIMYNNSSSKGGAMYFYSPNSIVINNKIINNTASAEGGGIYYYGNRFSNINNNLIANNDAGTIGGGVYLSGCKSTFSNNTIANNKANTAGGGIYCYNNSDPVLRNTIIYGNMHNNSSFTANQLYISDNLSDPKFYNCDIKGGKNGIEGGGSGVEYSGDYDNNIDINPDFEDPTASYGSGSSAINKDFSLTQGSLCINTGTEDISTMNLPDNDLDDNDRVYNGRIDIGAYENQDEIIAQCNISQNTVWDAQEINIKCNMVIDNGVTLTIMPGTKVLFTDKYKITVNGAIQAKGTANSPILFTASDLTNFENLSLDEGGWRGIEYNSPAASNDSSIYTFCNFTYGKAVGVGDDENGGAFNISDFQKIAIKNCKFSNNGARKYGGAIYIENSNIVFHNNLVVNNHADNTASGKGGGMYILDCSIDFKNNTIANNSSKYGGGIYIYTSTAPSFEGSIFYGNNTIGSSSGKQIHTLLCSNISFKYCDIQGGESNISGNSHITNYIGNYDIDPDFVDPTPQYGLSYIGLNANWKLKPTSPIINSNFSTSIVNYDLADEPRKVADTLDIGAYEVQMSTRFITEQPITTFVCIGTIATLSTKSSLTANYQWQKNGASIAGATYRKYIIPSIADSDTAFYNCIVSSDYGGVSTDTVWLGTKVGPTVTSQPTATDACIASSATFTASINGTQPIYYQWYNTNGALSGGSNNTFTINSTTANDASTYRLQATNECGLVLTNGALLSIKTPPTVTPINATADVCENGAVSFTTTASGAPTISYQWYKDGVAIVSNANAISYSISNASTSNAGNYYCEATNICGTDQTNQSVLTVDEKPLISSQSSSLTVCEGQSVSIYVTTTGTGPISYQWYKGSNAIVGATNNTYTISSVSLTDDDTYYCK